MSYVHIEIEHTGYGWRAEVTVSGAQIIQPLLHADSREEIFAAVHKALDTLEATRPTKHPAVIQDAPVMPIMPRASRRSKAQHRKSGE